jgi:CRISPR-associated protein Cas1
MRDYHVLPKFSDGLSFVYLDKGHIDKDQQSISYHTDLGAVPLPVASLALVMLGPGTTITHAAVKVMADNDCLVAWCGEAGVRFYATGMGRTRSSERLLRQARLACDSELHQRVVRRMYEMRFAEPLPPDFSLQQVRGKEGARVRDAYATASEHWGIPWTGRSYKVTDWHASDPVNQALSAANACLYGIVHAAVSALGYSPALGFIHTGKMLSFVYDIADLYKTDVTIPVAFEVTALGPADIGRAVRYRCRDTFRQTRLLQRMAPDIQEVLDVDHDTGEGPSGIARRTESLDDRAQERRVYWERVLSGEGQALGEGNEPNEIFWWDPADLERE